MTKPWTLERTLGFLPFAILVATFDRAVVTPMLVSMGADFDVNIATITVSVSVYLLAYGFAQPVWGIISDRLGRTATMRLALVLAGIFDIISVIPMPIEAFIAARGIAGATMAGVFPTAVIFIGDMVSDPRKRQAPMANLQTGVALGLTLGTVLGGLGVAFVGWQAFFIATGLVCFLIAWYVRGMPNPKPGAERLPVLTSFRIVFTNHWAWILYALVFLEAGALLGGFSLVPAALEEAGSTPAVAGLVTGAYGVMVLVTSMYVRKRAAHLPPYIYLLVGGISASIAFALLTWMVSPAIVVVSVALQGIAWVTMHPTLQVWSTTLSVEARATAVSLFAGFMFLGNGVGAQIAGYLLDFEGARIMFAVITAATIVLTITSVLSSRRYVHRLG